MLLLKATTLLSKGMTGRVTRTGQQYNNTYCLVGRVVAGRIREAY